MNMRAYPAWYLSSQGSRVSHSQHPSNALLVDKRRRLSQAHRPQPLRIGSRQFGMVTR